MVGIVSPPIFGTKRQGHKSQAPRMDAVYGPGVRLMKAIGLAARQARKDAGRKQIHIAVAIGEDGVDQSTVSRFEGGGGPKKGQPRYLEKYLLCYEAETGTSMAAILRDACVRLEAEPPTTLEIEEAMAGRPDPALPLADDDPAPESRQSGSVGKVSAAKRKRAAGGGRR